MTYWIIQIKLFVQIITHLIAHLCLRPCAQVLIYRKVHCLCNEYKNLKRSECFWSLKTCFFLVFFSKLDNVSSPIVSQSLTVTHTLCQENVFKFESRKNHTFCCLLFKELQICALTILREKWRNCFCLCAACVTVPSSDWPIAVI